MTPPNHVQTAADDRVALGKRLRAERQRAGMTLRGTAAALGVSAATWSAVENGRTAMPEARLLAAADLFGIDASALRAASTVEADALPLTWRDFPAVRLPSPLDAALAAFVDLGYHGATIREIAHRAKLSVAGIYHHWPNKQTLLVALLDLSMDDLLARARAARAEGDGPIARLCALVECLALFHTHRRDLGFIGASEMRSVDEPDRARIAALRTEMQRMVDEEVLEGCRRGVMATTRPHEAARAVVTLCTALPQWWSPTGRLSPAAVAEMYVEFACDVVRVRR